jgi:hypothetical protein
MKNKAWYLVMVGLLVMAAALSGCKKSKCGCGGEIIFNVESEVGSITVSKTDKYAVIETESTLGRFEVCHPDSSVLNIPTGSRVIFSGEAMDDCIKQYYQYYYWYYVIHITAIEKID